MAKKRYYQDKKDRMDESKSMKKAMKKKRGGDSIKYVSEDDSLFGFPAQSKVIDYPKTMYMNENTGANNDDIRGTDYEIDMNVRGLNNNKATTRW